MIAYPEYGLQTIWSGSGGSLEIRPFGNLFNLSQIDTDGFLAIFPDGSMNTRVILAANNTLTFEGQGTQTITVAVTPSSVVELFNAQVGGVAIGAATDTINFIQGTNISLTPSYIGGVFGVQVSAPNLALNTDHFITTQAASDLSNAFNLGSLGSGILKQSVTSSVSTPAIATGNVDYMLPNNYLLDIYNMSPSNGCLMYFTGGHWTPLAPSSVVGQVLTTITASSVLGWTDASAVADTWSQYPATQNVNMAGFLINNLGTPVLETDACTKGYADSIIGGAPVGAYYLTTRTNGALINETNLGSLSTGLVLSTVSGGNSTISTVPVSSFQPANLTASVTTTDATPTTLATVPVPTNDAVTLNGIVVAKNSTYTAAVGGLFNVTAINNAGTLTIMGTPLVAINASSTEIFNIIVSGTNLILQVTGIAATTYTWNANYTTATL